MSDSNGVQGQDSNAVSGSATADGDLTSEEPKKAVTHRGLVKWFNDAKGFGFIEHSSGKDVFVHYSVIEWNGFKTLKDGEEVEYELKEGEKGLHAARVARPNVSTEDSSGSEQVNSVGSPLKAVSAPEVHDTPPQAPSSPPQALSKSIEVEKIEEVISDSSVESSNLGSASPASLARNASKSLENNQE